MISSQDRSGKRRIVITGVGAICPLGSNSESIWEALSTRKSGVGPLTSMPLDSFPITVAAEANQFLGKIDDFGPLEKDQKKAIRKGLKVMCRECQMGVAAAQLALSDSGIMSSGLDLTRVGISYGSDYMLSLPDEFIEGVAECIGDNGKFVFERWATEGMPQMSPLWLLKYLPNMPGSHLAIFNDLQGPNNSVTLREASSNYCIGEAANVMRRGRADVMLVGATGTRLHPMKTIHCVQQEELASEVDDPTKASRPFDRDRTGMVLGEGSGAIVLEELEAAKARGAKILGEVVATASSSAIEPNMIARRDEAIANVLRGVLNQAEMSPDGIGHVHAHGLGTHSSDADEARAIAGVFGRRAKAVPVVAAKSYFGNLGAGGGMVELIASLLAQENGRLFPVLNYDTPDPECQVNAVTDDTVPAGDTFVNVSVSPQGQASAALVGRI
ncbi:MAG: beta-ketoacyl-[acyl-carrier-protein] synthase family protein [Planctomycetota bacterium]|nr:beta-ketoacyl-[acyl-carrier-protein] synthase family protein [Planctomycetota bacterium]